WEFQAGVRLNRERNRIQVQLPPELKLKANEPPAVEVACARPEKGQRLHLMVIGPGQRDQQALADAVLKAFLAEKGAGGRFRPPAFEDGTLYGPLPADVRRETVRTKLAYLQRTLRHPRDPRGPLNDVVVVFFSGEEAVLDNKLYLLTEESRRVRPGEVK